MSFLVDDRINFQNSTAGKPANLQNSAVLRMLEEEEQRQRQSPSNGYDSDRPLRDQIKWPPPDFEHRNHLRSSFKDVVKPGLKRVAWPPPQEGEGYIEQPAVETQGGPQYPSQTPNLQNNYASAPQQQASQAPSQRYPLKPLDISNGTNYQQPSSASPLANQSPLGYGPAATGRQWASVQSPIISPGQPQYRTPTPTQQSQQQSQYYQQTSQQYQSVSQQYQAPQQYQPALQQYQSSPQQYQSQQQYQAPPTNQYQPLNQQYQPLPQQSQPVYQQSPQPAAANQVSQPFQQPARQVEPPPATITLRQQAPVSQAPPPVVTSQPATATLKGGKNLRGDMKWPPENVKTQIEEENRQRVELARGPAFRPRLVRKDYGPFFAQHALNASYPGYKAPPGTQFYDHRPVY